MHHFFPDFISDYKADQRLADAKSISNRLLRTTPRSPQAPYFTNTLPFKFPATTIPFIPSDVMATFCNFVVNIILIGAQKKMRGIHARRIIAGMEHMQPSRDGSYVKAIRDSMRPIHLSVETKESISLVTFGRHPFPASLWVRFFRHLLPKISLLPWRKDELYAAAQSVTSIFSGGHKICMAIVRAFGPLDTAPTLAPPYPSSAF